MDGVRELLREDFQEGASLFLSAITDSDLSDLQDLLDRHPSDDPYQRSAAYYAMTGRHGLWWVRNENAAIVFCRHPNCTDEILVFPPIGKGGDYLMTRTLQVLSVMGERVRLARVNGSLPADELSAEPISEDVLDWAYPVRTIDTAAVAALRGRKLQNVRTALNHLDHSRMSVCDLDAVKHAELVRSVVEQWSDGDTDMSEPYDRLLGLFDKVPLAGRVVFYDGQPAGFSMWEKTDPARGMANALALIGLRDIRGLSQFVIVDMCRTLDADGFEKVCLGGSETEGLDQFKRNFNPAQSTRLASYKLAV